MDDELEIKYFEKVDMSQFEADGHLDKINDEFFAPLGYYLLYVNDSSGEIFELVELGEIENDFANLTGVDLEAFESEGHLKELNTLLKPLGYYLLYGRDAFSGEYIFEIINTTPVEAGAGSYTISSNSYLWDDILGN